jgi:ribosome-associated toxin RatA of RatAB toxin-antitoxin module
VSGAVLVIAWAAASGGAPGTPAAAADAPGRFIVDASFQVSAGTDTAWAVLTDYDHLSEFVPSMESSRLVDRKGPEAVVEQEARGKFLVFRRSVKIHLHVHEDSPVRIAFEDTSGQDFELYRGDWRLQPEEGSLSVRYHL